MSGHYVRSWNPQTDAEEWSGPFPAHMAGCVAEGLSQKGCTTRVYHRSELPGIDARSVGTTEPRQEGK